MSDLGLTYTQIKAADNTYQYQLEPDLSLLSQFTGKIKKKFKNKN